MQLISVQSITATSSETMWDFAITADIGNGPEPMVFAYSAIDTEGLSAQIAHWWADNPEAIVASYLPPPEPPATEKPLSKRQLVAALILGAQQTDPDGFIEAAIAAIADPVDRALALNDWRNAPYFVRTHALFNDPDLLAAVGMNGAAIDGLWSLAVTLPQ